MSPPGNQVVSYGTEALPLLMAALVRRAPGARSSARDHPVIGFIWGRPGTATTTTGPRSDSSGAA